jgi:hypothetical protein
VSSYTITITPDDSSNATATVRVNLGADGARITELTLRAGDPAGFPPGSLPGLDLDVLLGAFASAATDSTTGGSTTGGSTTRGSTTRGSTTRGSLTRGSLTRGSTANGSADARPTTPGRKAPAKPTRTRAVTAEPASGGPRSAKPSRGERSEDTATGRPYRRMPEDVAEVYQQAGGATGVANHYGVPRHTAQGWLRRLRQQGLLPAAA